jgi:hypothetical protein
LDEFLELLGQRIQLKDHKGWVGMSEFYSQFPYPINKGIYEKYSNLLN